MPGPVLTITISESTRRGFWAGPLIVLGHGFLEVILLILLVVGLAKFINQPKVTGLVGMLGGAILLWTSLSMFRDLKKLRLNFNNAPARGGNPLANGILMSLVNPYWTIWWATIGLSYVFISMKFGVTGLIIFFFGHILADLIWYSTISFLVSRGRRHISMKVYRGIISACAAVLIFFGAFFGILGLTAFL